MSRRVLDGQRLFIGVILPLAVLVACVGTLLALGRREPERRPQAGSDRASRLWRLPPAEVQSVRGLDEVNQGLQIRADGVVVPYREIQLATEVDGRIIYKDEDCEAGTYVTEGQLLIRIDPAEYELEIERLEKQQRQEYEAIRELEQEIVNTRRLVDVAEQELELQERELQRLRNLPSGFASEAEIDQARRARLQALNNQTTLENQLQLLAKRQARLEAAEQLAATQLERARLDLRRTEIRSPIDGVILREDAEVNSYVQRGATVATLDQTDRVEVATNLRMEQLHWVLDQTPGGGSEEELMAAAARGREYRLPPTPVTIQYEVAGREGEVFEWEGRLVRYDGVGMDPDSRTVPVTIVVEEPNRWRDADGSMRQRSGPAMLVRGMFVRAILHVQPQTPLVVVPSLGLRPGNRAWRFVADPSVLDRPIPDAAGPEGQGPEDEGPEDEGGGDEAPEPPEMAGFDPEAWRAGRVELVERIRPISGVWLGEAEEDAERAPNKYWICEVVGEPLRPGDAIVVSPISAMAAEDGQAVRVPRSQFGGEPGAVVQRQAEPAEAAAPERSEGPRAAEWTR